MKTGALPRHFPASNISLVINPSTRFFISSGSSYKVVRRPG